MVDIFPFSALDGRIAAFVPERPKKKGERLLVSRLLPRLCLGLD
jgi:hypothetical protein